MARTDLARTGPAAPVVARRLSAALCLAIGLGFAAGLHHWTAGFEAWTFEGRRQVQLQAGELHAHPVPMRGIDGGAPTLWGEGSAAPAAYLVDFIYTRCPGVCRALGTEYQQMQRELAGPSSAPPLADPARAGVRLVSVSFDVAHDDAPALARYASSQRADPRWWTITAPATAEHAGRLLRSLGVVAVPDGQGGFVHNGALHLLDARGRLRGLYDFEQWPQALDAARRLAGAEAAGSR